MKKKHFFILILIVFVLLIITSFNFTKSISNIIYQFYSQPNSIPRSNSYLPSLQSKIDISNWNVYELDSSIWPDIPHFKVYYPKDWTAQTIANTSPYLEHKIFYAVSFSWKKSTSSYDNDGYARVF